MNLGLYSKLNRLSFSDAFNKRTQSSWRFACDNRQYLVDQRYGMVFYAPSLDDIERLERRFISIKNRLDELTDCLFSNIKERLKQNPTKSLIIGEGDVESKYFDYCYIDPKTDNPSVTLGIAKDAIESRNVALNYTGSIQGSMDLIKLRDQRWRLLTRFGVFYSAMSLSLIRFIETKSNYTDCLKQYHAGKLNEYKFRELFENKIVNLNFSGREYLYFFDTNHSRIPELKEICWSDGKMIRFAFGENK